MNQQHSLILVIHVWNTYFFFSCYSYQQRGTRMTLVRSLVRYSTSVTGYCYVGLHTVPSAYPFYLSPAIPTNRHSYLQFRQFYQNFNNVRIGKIGAKVIFKRLFIVMSHGGNRHFMCRLERFSKFGRVKCYVWRIAIEY